MAKNEYLEVKDIISKSIKLKKDQKYNEARSLLKDTLQKYPDNKYVKSSLADLLSRMGELDEAFNLAEGILKNNPDDSRALIVKGNIFFSKREYKKALEYFKQALENDNSNYLYSRLIRTHMQLENFEKAEELSQKKLDEDPENSSFKNLMARIYEKMGKDNKAARYLDDYLKENPDDEFAYKEKLKMKMKNKDPKKAVEELRALLKVGDKSNNVFLHHLLAEKLEKLNKYDKALLEYEKSLELEPGNSFAIKQAGFCLYKMDENEKALNYLKEAFRNDPSDYYVKSTLVSIFKKTKKINEGISFFKEIINNNQGFNKLWGTIKKLSKELGDNDE